MRKISLCSNMKVRTSLILVLVFFLLMLMAGAALGLWSLYADKRAMRQLAAHPAIRRQLNASVIPYKNKIGRASCRERVWQYGLVLVDGGILKKQKQRTNETKTKNR